MRSESSPSERATHPLRPGIRATCSRLLLLVATIQGITPDLNDLASSRAFQLLLGAVTPGRARQDQRVDQGEMSSPAGVPDSARFRREGEPTREPGSPAFGSLDGRAGAGAIAAPRHRGASSGFDPPSIYRLCRLSC